MVISVRNPQRLAAMYYLFFFGAAGGLMPYLNLYFQDMGMGTRRIGVLAALLTASTLFAGPLWSAIADIFHLHHRLLPLLMAITLPLAIIMATTSQFVVLLVFVFL